MKDISHAACTSGGCWAAVPHAYTTSPEQQLLGSYTPPELLTVAKLLATDAAAGQLPNTMQGMDQLRLPAPTAGKRAARWHGAPWVLELLPPQWRPLQHCTAMDADAADAAHACADVSGMSKWTHQLARQLMAPLGLGSLASTTCAVGTAGDICAWTRQRLGSRVKVRPLTHSCYPSDTAHSERAWRGTMGCLDGCAGSSM
jgi:hypothetical protein